MLKIEDIKRESIENDSNKKIIYIDIEKGLLNNIIHIFTMNDERRVKRRTIVINADKLMNLNEKERLRIKLRCLDYRENVYSKNYWKLRLVDGDTLEDIK